MEITKNSDGTYTMKGLSKGKLLAIANAFNRTKAELTTIGAEVSDAINKKISEDDLVDLYCKVLKD